MGYRRIFLIGFIFILGLTSMSLAEDYSLQYFWAKTSSKTTELSKKERTELFNQLDGVLKQAQTARTRILQDIQTGETNVPYREGKFWTSKLERDRELIDTGIQQIKLLQEKPTLLVASIRLYKSLKDLSSNFNAYNNFPPFSAWVGDLAPEMELWADPIFFTLYLLPLARSKDVEIKTPPKDKKTEPKEKKPTSTEKKPTSKEKKP